MKANKLSYEEQVLMLGNGTMLEPGCYDEGLNIIGCFSDCNIECDQKKNVLYVICPESLESVTVEMFKDMENLQKVILSKDLKKIESYAFAHKKRLTNIQIPDGLEVIGMYSFSGSGLKSIEIPSSVKVIDHGAFHSSDLESFLMPKADSVVNIEDIAFLYCNALESVILPEGLKQINRETFGCCGFEEITIPDSVVEIKRSAFKRAFNLRCIRFGKNTQIKNISNNAFTDTKEELTFDFDGVKMDSSLLFENLCVRLKTISRYIRKNIRKNKSTFSKEEIECVRKALESSPDLVSKGLVNKVNQALNA